MTENSQQTHPATPEEDIKVLYGRVAKLNDIASALLAPAWGSETGIIPTDHPLYVGEKPPAEEEQGAPVDWQAIVRDRERELKAMGEARHRAEAERDQLRETAGAALGRAGADRAALIEARMRERARQAAIERVRKALAVRLADDECGEQERRGYHSALIDVGRALDDGDEPAPSGPATTVATGTRPLTVQQEDALWDAIAVPGPGDTGYVEQHERVCRTVREMLREATCPVEDVTDEEPLTTGTDDNMCGAEPPRDGTWGDCWCTRPTGHDGPCKCEPCTARHGAPGWTYAGPLTPAEESRTAQSGVDTPGCTCGHTGKGLAWHDTTCPWRHAWDDSQLADQTRGDDKEQP